MLISWELGSILVALAFEAGVLLRTFTRPAQLIPISLAIAPLIAALALVGAPEVSAMFPQQFARGRIDQAAVFLLGVLMEIPLSLQGQPLSPAASFLERLVVAGSFTVASVLTAKSLLGI